jgi:aldose sugar dehydrogenase
VWAPIATAPSGMMFYTGSQFPEWQGSVFVGALLGRTLWRLPLVGNTLGPREPLFADLAERIRDVRQGPDGLLYVVTEEDDAALLRIEPVE